MFIAVPLEDVGVQDYVLNPGVYVGIPEDEEENEPFEEKMSRLTSELYELYEEAHMLEEETRKKLRMLGFAD